MYTHKILRIRVQTAEPFDYRAGQYVQLHRADGLVRAYSLANQPRVDPSLELHVCVHAHGRMSRWLAEQARAGQRVELRGPAEGCFYTQGDPTQPLLLAGTGTGLAPLFAIARDALQSGHAGPITLIHGADDHSGLYFEDALAMLADEHPNFAYRRCVLSGPCRAGVEQLPLAELAKQTAPRLAGWCVFACGSRDVVAAVRRQSFMAGAALKDICADAFVAAPTLRPASSIA